MYMYCVLSKYLELMKLIPRLLSTGGVETVVTVGAPSRADGSFGAWLRPGWGATT